MIRGLRRGDAVAGDRAALRLAGIIGALAVLPACGDPPKKGGELIPLDPPPPDAGGELPPCSPHDARMSERPHGGSEEWTWSSDDVSCYRPVAFPTPCAVKVAEQPWLAAPPLRFRPCDSGEAGCQMRDDSDWSALFQNRSTEDFSVVRHGGGYRVGMRIWGEVDGKWEMRAVVYDERGVPMAVWRSTDSHCSPFDPLVMQDHVWFSIGHGDEGAQIRASYDELSTVSEAIPFTGGHQGYAGDERTLAMWALDGRTLSIYDELSGTTRTFGPSSPGPSFLLPTFAPAGAVATGYTSQLVAGVFVWNRETGDMTELVTPAPGQIAPFVATDGTTLAWISADLPKSLDEPLDLPNPWIWTSPFSATPGALSPVKRRPAPPIGASRMIAGEGFMAFRANDGHEHIYRLSDMREWVWAPEGEAISLMYIDADEIWAWGLQHMFRQRLDALGPGSPAPT